MDRSGREDPGVHWSLTSADPLPRRVPRDHPSVRNSLVPLIAAVLLIALALLLIRPIFARGQGGPEVNPGILRLPKRDPLRTQTMDISSSTAARLTAGSPDNGQWNTVLIVGEDNSAVTRATMLALGEVLYQAGCIAIMDPVSAVSVPAPPLPFPADRVIRVQTIAATTGDDLQAAWSMSVELRLSEPRLPPGHPAEGWQPPPAGHANVCLVLQDDRPTAGANGSWPERWASSGRAIVGAALKTMVAPPGIACVKRPFESEWNTAVPQTSELRWYGYFQHDFIRGWIGRLPGRTVTTKTGNKESVDAPLIRLLASGSWVEGTAEGSWRCWSRPHNGIRQHVALSTNDTGVTATTWIEQPGIPALVERWVSEAAAGNVLAKTKLARAATVSALSDDLRARAAAAAR